MSDNLLGFERNPFAAPQQTLFFKEVERPQECHFHPILQRAPRLPMHTIYIIHTLASFPGLKNERPGTHCMRMRSIPQNLGNPVISVNYCSLSRLENEASLDARLPSMLKSRVAEAIDQAQNRFTLLRDNKPLWPSYTYSAYVSVYLFE